MKNKLVDLNNHLFAQIERLSDEELTEEGLAKECKRTEAIVRIGEQIIENAALALSGAKLVAEYGGKFETMLPMLENKDAVMEDRRDARDKPRKLA